MDSYISIIIPAYNEESRIKYTLESILDIKQIVLRPNYKKDMIPVSMGIVFLPMIVINGIILAFFTTEFKNLAY
ncbi:glycosyltransferase, partial [Clostridioides difficile]|uniref:glycosyltransferase n=1 Tax=Clostridioides difficile TaxID=1496 RepID=UPI002ED2060A